MASRRIDSVERTAEEHWRSLAQRADYNLQTVAQLVGVSVRQLERLCQRELGCTPTEWLDRERMAAAVRLLTEGQAVKVVALQLGYSRPANFSRDFKRHFGRPPSALVPQHASPLDSTRIRIQDSPADRLGRTMAILRALPHKAGM